MLVLILITNCQVRIITEKAWHSLFARNMFITTEDRDELKKFIPDFTVIALPSFKLDPAIDGTRSETGIILNFADNELQLLQTHFTVVK